MNDKGAAMTRYEEIEKVLREARKQFGFAPRSLGYEYTILSQIDAALALPEDSKTVNAELYGLAVELADSVARSDIECLCIRDPASLDFKLEPVFDDEPECVADVARARRYLSLREASGEPMPYKVVRDGDKVRFE